MVNLLNPIIRGWANYHHHAAAKRTFCCADHMIWQKIWQWCKRRHPGKGKRWVKRKYFTNVGKRNQIFFGINANKQINTLFLAASVPIVRHIKIRGTAAVYDPSWEAYFEERLERSWIKNQWGKNKVITLWRRQNMRCPLYQQHITKETGWNIHHKVMRCKGGDDTLSNLVLLHPICHQQLHHSDAGHAEIQDL